jgi:hypothetical protein
MSRAPPPNAESAENDDDDYCDDWIFQIAAHCLTPSCCLNQELHEAKTMM